MKRLLIGATCLLFAGAAFAQSTVIVTQDPQPAPTAVVVPGEVTTYVTEQEVPSVDYEGDVAVGSALPGSVEVHTIPSQNGYAYTVINKQRVIVDPQSRKIVEIVR